MTGEIHELITVNTQHLMGKTKENHGRLEQDLNLGLFKYEAGVLNVQSQRCSLSIPSGNSRF